MKQQLNIALIGNFSWGGGIDLLRLIANALVLKAKEQLLRIFLLLPDDKKVNHIYDMMSISKRILIHREYSLITKKEPEFLALLLDAFRNVDGSVEIERYYRSRRGFINSLKRIKADIALPAATSLGNSFQVPWVGYIWDFQHKYYPEFFTSSECLDRDITIATTLRDAKAIIVNSMAVKNDIDKYFPYHKCKVFNLPFAPNPISSWLDEPTEGLQKKYDLPDKYFLISNQFWLHKSHTTAFQALALLDSRDIHIVCTGNTNDYRFPDYHNDLKEIILQLGLQNRIHFLGYIPKFDQINIMKRALAVLQPTLFEGGPGGGAVYDAIALGVTSIVSDIPVNREIEDEAVLFFRTESAKDMADKMNLILMQQKEPIEKDVLISKGLTRISKLGDCLLEAIDFAISK